MIIENQFIGVLGIEKRNQILESDRKLLEEVAKLLDTTIFQSCKQRFLKDENRILRKMDEIVDENLDDPIKCEKALLRKISNISKAAFACLFEGSESNPFNLISTNELGRIVWREYPEIALEMKKIVQECAEDEQEMNIIYSPDDNLKVADFNILNIAAFPLVTKGGESGGVLVLGSYNILSKGHRRLVRNACKILDTSIIRRRHTELMMKRYSKYVGSEILNVLLENPEWLNARKENIVVFSADLVGSTEYAAAEPDAFKTFNLVNKYLKLIAKTVIEDFNGTLDKFIGDEVMALFGAPVKDHNAPFIACDCALAVKEKIFQLNEEAERKGEHTFSVKITIGFANVVIGEVGSQDTQTDYTALGDEVNQVFRMANYGIPNEIIVNQKMKEITGEEYKYEFVQEAELKGIKKPQEIYRLIAKRGS